MSVQFQNDKVCHPESLVLLSEGEKLSLCCSNCCDDDDFKRNGFIRVAASPDIDTSSLPVINPEWMKLGPSQNVRTAWLGGRITTLPV